MNDWIFMQAIIWYYIYIYYIGPEFEIGPTNIFGEVNSMFYFLLPEVGSTGYSHVNLNIDMM